MALLPQDVPLPPRPPPTRPRHLASALQPPGQTPSPRTSCRRCPSSLSADPSRIPVDEPPVPPRPEGPLRGTGSHAGPAPWAPGCTCPAAPLPREAGGCGSDRGLCVPPRDRRERGWKRHLGGGCDLHRAHSSPASTCQAPFQRLLCSIPGTSRKCWKDPPFQVRKLRHREGRQS